MIGALGVCVLFLHAREKSFLHRICCAKLFKAAKIHVQIMRVTCCLNMAFNLTKPKPGPDILA